MLFPAPCRTPGPPPLPPPPHPAARTHSAFPASSPVLSSKPRVSSPKMLPATLMGTAVSSLRPAPHARMEHRWRMSVCDAIEAARQPTGCDPIGLCSVQMAAVPHTVEGEAGAVCATQASRWHWVLCWTELWAQRLAIPLLQGLKEQRNHILLIPKSTELPMPPRNLGGTHAPAAFFSHE